MDKNPARHPSKERKIPTLKDLEAYRFDPTNQDKLTPPAPTLLLNQVPICTPRNLSNIQGQAKSAKSSVLGAAMAAMLRSLTGKPQDDDSQIETLKFTSKLSPNNGSRRQIILHFDTEQSDYHHHKLGMDVLKRAGLESTSLEQIPFYSYSLVCLDLHERWRLIKERVDQLKTSGESLACLVLDGIADVVSDPNNADDSNILVSELHGLAAFEGAVVLTILHENPKTDNSGGKARGHLGSQIQRKSETNLCVQKSEHEISSIWTERSRGQGIPSKDSIRISWCPKKKRHLLHDRPREASATHSQVVHSTELLTRKESGQKQWLGELLASRAINHKDFLKSINKRYRVRRGAAINRINEWLSRDWIHKSEPDNPRSPYALGPAPKATEPKPKESAAPKSKAKKVSAKKTPTNKNAGKKSSTRVNADSKARKSAK